MNREALTQLRNYITDLPDEQFGYQQFFGDSRSTLDWWHGKMPECGTAACVAGHACLMFQLQGTSKDGFRTPSAIAGEFLGLDADDGETLFYAACGVASKDDAIRRMDYLLEHETLAGYSMAGESWWEHRVSHPQAYQEALAQSLRPAPVPQPTVSPASASPGIPSQMRPTPAPRKGSSSTGGYAARAIHLQCGQPAESLSSES